MEYWEFLFYGKSQEDIHGITLREEIRRIASLMNINGTVKNLKKDGTVKVLCQVNDETSATEFFTKILKIGNPLINEKIDERKSEKIKIRYEPGDKAPVFSDFQIEREDELTEMVWALQGAGQLFIKSSTLQEKILNTIQKRDGVEEYFILYALMFELGQIETELDEVILNINNAKGQTWAYDAVCLRNFYIKPPLQETEQNKLVDQVGSIYLKLNKDLQKLIWDSEKGVNEKKNAVEMINGIKGDISALKLNIEEIIKKLEKTLKPCL